jgi:hypothetical protein
MTTAAVRAFPVHREAPDVDGVPRAIPWEALAPHENQARINHHQTLEQLARRGGLTWSELCAVLHDRQYSPFDEREAARHVAAILRERGYL